MKSKIWEFPRICFQSVDVYLKLSYPWRLKQRNFNRCKLEKSFISQFKVIYFVELKSSFSSWSISLFRFSFLCHFFEFIASLFLACKMGWYNIYYTHTYTYICVYVTLPSGMSTLYTPYRQVFNFGQCPCFLKKEKY